MRSSRSARRAGLNSRIDRGPLGGVKTNPTANAKTAAMTARTTVRRMGCCGFYYGVEVQSVMRMSRVVVVAAGVVAVLSGACGGITTPSSNQTEQFSGTLQAKGANTHNFNVSKTGEFTAKLTAWAPNTQIFAGLALTLANGDGSCTVARQQNNFVLVNAQA